MLNQVLDTIESLELELVAKADSLPDKTAVDLIRRIVYRMAAMAMTAGRLLLQAFLDLCTNIRRWWTTHDCSGRIARAWHELTRSP